MFKEVLGRSAGKETVTSPPTPMGVPMLISNCESVNHSDSHPRTIEASRKASLERVGDAADLS